MKILLATSGSRGDVQPILALALAFQRHGHDVLMAGPPERAEWAREMGCAYAPLGENATAVIDRMGAAHTLRAVPTFVRYVKNEIALQFRDLPDLVSGRDLVIGASLCFALSSIAERVAVPYRFIAFAPQLLPSGDHPFPIFKHQNMPRWLNRLGWRALRAIDRVQMGAYLNSFRRTLGLAPTDDWLRHVLGDPVVAASDPEITVAPEDVGGSVLQPGYMHLAQPPREFPALERFLAAGPPPVYVGFGSMPGKDQSRLLPLVTEAGRNAGCRLVIARFWDTSGEDRLADDVFFIRRYPHRDLFPRMAAVVHHGGAGTTATAAISGVPQVVVPHILDQFFWGDRVHRAGLGPEPVWRTRLNRRRLADAMTQCLSRPAFATIADKLGRDIRRRDGTETAVRAIIDSL